MPRGLVDLSDKEFTQEMGRREKKAKGEGKWKYPYLNPKTRKWETTTDPDKDMTDEFEAHRKRVNSLFDKSR